MVRNSASRTVHIAIAVLGWVAAAGVVQGLLRPELGASVRRLDEAIELRLRGAEAAPQPPPHLRSRESESIDPWELVGV